MDFIAATNNAHKLAEMRRILERLGHTVCSQKEAGIALDPEENGTTFAENAVIKAKAICAASGKATIADDSGLCVQALGGAPGVYSARYCGVHGNDEANNDKLLQAMHGEKNRAAKFVSSICVYLPDNRHFTFEGECCGTIGTQRKGTNGFGYDPLFIPDTVGVSATETAPNTQQRTYAELSADEKDAISHRGRALALMEQNLARLLLDKTVIGSTVGDTTIELKD